MIDGQALIEDVKSGQSHFDLVAFAEKLTHRSIPDWNVLFEVKTVIAEDVVIQVAFEESLFGKLVLHVGIDSRVADFLVLTFLNRIADVGEIEATRQCENQFRCGRCAQIHVHIAASAGCFVLNSVHKSRVFTEIDSPVDRHGQFRFDERTVDPKIAGEFISPTDIFRAGDAQDTQLVIGLDDLVVYNLAFFEVVFHIKIEAAETRRIPEVEACRHAVRQFRGQIGVTFRTERRVVVGRYWTQIVELWCLYAERITGVEVNVVGQLERKINVGCNVGERTIYRRSNQRLVFVAGKLTMQVVLQGGQAKSQVDAFVRIPQARTQTIVQEFVVRKQAQVFNQLVV